MSQNAIHPVVAPVAVAPVAPGRIPGAIYNDTPPGERERIVWGWEDGCVTSFNLDTDRIAGEIVDLARHIDKRATRSRWPTGKAEFKPSAAALNAAATWYAGCGAEE